MEYIPSYFKLSFKSSADPDAMVASGRARFTVLTARMIRIEWSPEATFEDRPSQAFWFRQQPVPAFQTESVDGERIIETDALRLHYTEGQPFTGETLWIELKPMRSVWHYGDPDPDNLGGTARTVDGVDGATPLSLGLISRAGWSVVDDTGSLVFNQTGWLEQRNELPGQLDLYFLGFGHDYLAALREFTLISGAVPMVPRFILGNWWSRYWRYTQAELEQLVDDFQAHNVPLSVCIIDMDWHITKTGNTSTGWTGYTWNRELFPDPAGVLKFLHEKGLKVALNLHPAEGIHPHEEMYAEMAEAVGVDPKTQQPVEFDIANPRFTDAYFRILHHPKEKLGVDFWWMDWQQGVKSRLSGLDPLWWLNHIHFLDLGRSGDRRSFIFSRWGGIGNHRYPIGFSGDSVVSWASLAFQPYFTATSTNVNYGWWSHDIGGHMGGHEDPELYTRWVQLGVFLPVLRLHSTNNPYHDRRPWGHDANTFAAAQFAMQLRHALIPYLYSMAWRYHRDSIPPILPMYYLYPEQEDAYACPNQYLFGNQLLFAPFITPADPQTRLSRTAAWLPEGDWYDFFTGAYYPGGGWQAIYGTLNDIPAFAKAGAIVPQGPMAGWDNVEVPDHLIVNIFPGADGAFELYEDEGNTMSYIQGKYATTKFAQAWSQNKTTFTIAPAEGGAKDVNVLDFLPQTRTVDLRFRGFVQPAATRVTVNGAAVEAHPVYDPGTRTLTIAGLALKPIDRLEVTLSGGDLAAREDRRLAACLKLVKHFYMETWTKAELADRLPAILANPAELGRFASSLSEPQLRALFEVITGAGMDYTDSTGEPLIVVWNNHNDLQVSEQFSLAHIVRFWLYKERFPWSDGPAPRFKAYRPKVDFGSGGPWQVQVNYYGVTSVKEEKK